MLFEPLLGFGNELKHHVGNNSFCSAITTFTIMTVFVWSHEMML